MVGEGEHEDRVIRYLHDTARKSFCSTGYSVTVRLVFRSDLAGEFCHQCRTASINPHRKIDPDNPPCLHESPPSIPMFQLT